MQKITPFLWFDTTPKRRAILCLGLQEFPDPQCQSLRDAGPARKAPSWSVASSSRPAVHGLNGGPLFKFNEAFSFVVSCENQEEIDYTGTS